MTKVLRRTGYHTVVRIYTFIQINGFKHIWSCVDSFSRTVADTDIHKFTALFRDDYKDIRSTHQCRTAPSLICSYSSLK